MDDGLPPCCMLYFFVDISSGRLGGNNCYIFSLRRKLWHSIILLFCWGSPKSISVLGEKVNSITLSSCGFSSRGSIRVIWALYYIRNL